MAAPAPTLGWRQRWAHQLQALWWQPEPSGWAVVLKPLAGCYGWLARQAARRATRKSEGGDWADVPVLVVGNIIVGGAGKTPTVMALVQAFQAAGRRPAVVSRGYGRQGQAVRAVHLGDRPEQVGDEALLIRRRTGVPVWVGQDRRAALQALRSAHPEVDVVLSDDGLQHHRLPRQAELLVFDDRGIGNGLLLPAGPLRQPLPERLLPHQRVLYSGTRASTPLPGALGHRRIRLAWPLEAWLQGRAEAAIELTALQAEGPLLAVAGLAAPERFFAMLRTAGLDFQTCPLPDHHDYARLPWVDGIPTVLPTEKDAVKLDPQRLGQTRVWVLPLDFSLPPGLVEDLLSLLPTPKKKLPPP